MCPQSSGPASLATASSFIRPARGEGRRRPGVVRFEPLRLMIESIDATVEAKLSLECHGGHS
jgi:hypothetical protein